jgi:hypothetical protein
MSETEGNFKLFNATYFFPSTNLSRFPSTSISLPTSLSFWTLENQTSSPSATPKPSKLFPHPTSPTANAWDRHFSARDDLFYKQILSMTAWVPFTSEEQP